MYLLTLTLTLTFVDMVFVDELHVVSFYSHLYAFLISAISISERASFLYAGNSSVPSNASIVGFPFDLIGKKKLKTNKFKK